MAMFRGLIRGGQIEEKHANWTAAGESTTCCATRLPDLCSSLRRFIAKLVSKSVIMLRFRSTFEFPEKLDNCFLIESDLRKSCLNERRTPQDVSRAFWTPQLTHRLQTVTALICLSQDRTKATNLLRFVSRRWAKRPVRQFHFDSQKPRFYSCFNPFQTAILSPANIPF